MTAEQVFDLWVRAACRLYAKKNPDTPAVVCGSSAAKLLGLLPGETQPRDVDILPEGPVKRMFKTRYVDHNLNFSAYPIMASDSQEFEAGVRLPSRVAFVAAKLATDSTRDVQNRAMALLLSASERDQCKNILRTLTGNPKAEEALEWLETRE
jgi:hypothetical protein